jgi:hypothetical protein
MAAAVWAAIFFVYGAMRLKNREAHRSDKTTAKARGPKNGRG